MYLLHNEVYSLITTFQIKNPTELPFRIKCNGKGELACGEVSEKIFLPSTRVTDTPEDKSLLRCQQILKGLQETFTFESFGCTRGESEAESKPRLAIVMGLNRCESLDRQRNRGLQ